MTPTSAVLSEVLKAFLDRFSLGLVSVGRDAWSLMSILVTMEVMLFGLWWALSGSEAAAQAVKKIITIGFFAFVVQNYEPLIKVVSAGFRHTAEQAAGVGVAPMEDPSAILDAGITATLPALELARKRVGFSLSGMIDALIVFVCVLSIYLAFVVLAIQVFITRLEFGLITTLGLILIPFGVFQRTAFLAEKVFGAIVSFGVKLMVLAFIVAIAFPILATWALPSDPDWGHLLSMLAATFAIAALALHAPGVAAGLLAGSPSLSFHSAVGGVALSAAPMVMAARTTANSNAMKALTGTVKSGVSSAGSALKAGCSSAFHADTGGGGGGAGEGGNGTGGGGAGSQGTQSGAGSKEHSSSSSHANSQTTSNSTKGSSSSSSPSKKTSTETRDASSMGASRSAPEASLSGQAKAGAKGSNITSKAAGAGAGTGPAGNSEKSLPSSGATSQRVTPDAQADRTSANNERVSSGRSLPGSNRDQEKVSAHTQQVNEFGREKGRTVKRPAGDRFKKPGDLKNG